MQKEEILSRLLTTKVIPIARYPDSQPLIEACAAVKAGGIDTFEITMSVPGALDLLKALIVEFGSEMVFGAGTILDPETARAAILAGAEFIVQPTLSLEVIHMVHRYGKVVVPGALTPTEILTANEAGADFIKVFPVSSLGPGYIKAVLAPLPQVRLIPVGGVTPDNAVDYIRAGAVAVGIGSELMSKDVLASRNFDVLTDRARKLSDAIRNAL